MPDVGELRIGEHIDFLSGYPFASEFFSVDDGVPLIRIRDLSDSRIETKYVGPMTESGWSDAMTFL